MRKIKVKEIKTEIKVKEIKTEIKVKEIKSEKKESNLEKELDSDSFHDSSSSSDPKALITSLEVSKDNIVSRSVQRKSDDVPQFSESARYNINNRGEAISQRRSSYNVALQSNEPTQNTERAKPNVSQERPSASIRQTQEIIPASRRIDDNFSTNLNQSNFSNNLENERGYEERVDLSFQNSKKRNIWEA